MAHPWLGLLMNAALLGAAPVEEVVLDAERPLLVRTIELCESKDLDSLRAALPAFAAQLRKAGVEPDAFGEQDPGSGLVIFTAWGFTGEALPLALDRRVFFVELRMQESSGRTVAFCQVTDMVTDPAAMPPAVVETDWLRAIRPWTVHAASRHVAEATGSDAEDRLFQRHFDLSTPQAMQSIEVLRASHKIELTLLRAAVP